MRHGVRLLALLVCVASGWLLALMAGSASRPLRAQSSGGYALRFYGNGVSDIDRVKVRIDPQVPADVGGDFTIEFWLKTTAAVGACSPGSSGAGWITGRTIIDRDVYGNGDYGDYGISLAAGRICFGVERGATGTTIYGSTNVANGQWRHIAVTRSASSGQMRIFVDGQLDAQGTGPTGDISYRDGRATAYPNSDPFLVFGAEKHDAGSEYPSYAGLLDDIRISNGVRYTGVFTRPTAPHAVDGQTVALYRFDEGSGTTIIDSAPDGGSPGERRFGGSPAGPVYVADIPFSGALPSATPTRTVTPISGPLPSATSTPTATPTMTSVAFTATVTSTPTRTTNPTITPIVGISPLKPRAFLPFVQKP
ncbi:LamG domain-containing protein [Roseiflexus castenholzii]|uniref:LamG domain protein jellyroll fold domain protein n=1 Tax=Roseiflexus castenholzii (strain DSM 13941 / HLO8) TaxID=383372 RepID=A7NR01_ROSCS|nr:LamG domain-containing protein [Roseiflexus castenholzii]ABU59997.1 LamG domain protein jellyroll fold domain protein [Roseiflexus castenholzii DSM 13941]